MMNDFGMQKKALENGWSSTVLEHQIATKLINRQGNDAVKVTNLVAELALNRSDAPIGVADYKFMEEIPDYLSEVMPSIDELEKRLIEQKMINDH